MGTFEDMGFFGNLEFLSAPPGEGEVVPEREAEVTVEEDYTDDEIDVDELERRMWRDRMLLRRLKEQNERKQWTDNAKQRQSQEQARREKMSKKGKPVSGASDNLPAWWKEKVRFDRNGPAAIAKYQADHSIHGKNEDIKCFILMSML